MIGAPCGHAAGCCCARQTSSTVRWEMARSISRAAAQLSAGLSPRLPNRVSATRWCRWYSRIVPRPFSVRRLFPRYRETRPSCSRGVRCPRADGAVSLSVAAIALRETPRSGVSRARMACIVSSWRRVSLCSVSTIPEKAARNINHTLIVSIIRLVCPCQTNGAAVTVSTPSWQRGPAGCGPVRGGPPTTTPRDSLSVSREPYEWSDFAIITFVSR